MAEPARNLNEDDQPLSALERADQRWGNASVVEGGNDENIPKLNPSSNPAHDDYDKKFNRDGNSSASERSDRTGDADDPDRLNYTGDEERDKLADTERSGTSDTSSKAARSELRSHKGGDAGWVTRQAAGLSIGSKRSKMKKRVTVGILGTFGVGTLAVLLFIVFMLVSGFGVRQAGIVAKNYGMYRINRMGHSAITRVIEGDVRVKSGEGLGDVTPSSALDRARGLDIEKVIKNLEDDEVLTYARDADGKITDIIFNGEEKVSLDGLERNPLKRVDAYNTLSEQIERHSPALAETSNLTGKVADGILERTNAPRLRWSEKVLAKLRETKTPTEALGVEQETQLGIVRGDPPEIHTGDAAIDAAEDVANKEVKPLAVKGVETPVPEVIPAQMEAIEASTPILSRNAAGGLVEGASAVAMYTLCTINAVDVSYEGTVRQNNDASVRLAGQLQSASDQIAKGGEKVTAAGVGAARKSLADFQDQADYQKGSFNPLWKDFRQLPKVDQPQPRRDKGWMKLFHSISVAVNGVWDIGTNASGGGIIRNIPGGSNIPIAWNFTEFCSKINTPAGGLVFGVATGLIEHAALNSLFPVGGEAASAGADAVTEGFVKKLVATVGEKGIATAIKESITKLIEGGVNTISDISIEKIVNEYAKKLGKAALTGGVISAATIGMTYLIIKLANGAGGHTYNGTSDQDYASKAMAGTSVMQADLLRSRMYGVPTDPKINAAYLKQQYADYISDQSHKTLADRLLNFSNPYSVSARVASTAPFDPSTAKTVALNTLNPLNALNFSQSGIAMLASKLTDQKTAYAASLDDDEENDGVQQWGYTLEEEELMKQPEYSLVSISKWAGTKEGKDAISAFDDKFGFCYDTKYEMSDILLNKDAKGNHLVDLHDSDISNDGIQRCINDLKSTNASNPSLFKWRLYHLDIISVDQTKDIQDVAADPEPGDSTGDATGTGGGTGGGVGGGEISADSTGTPCATGTDDLGTRDDAYSAGKRLKIRICGIPNIPCNNEECTSIAGANGHAVVSSIASDPWFKLAAAATAAGNGFHATSSWRTMEHQTRLCNQNAKCRSGDHSAVAEPGRSNHQAGTAIDVTEASFGQGASGGRSCSNPQTANTDVYKWLQANARNYGVKNYANESWHWGTSEAC